MADVYNDVHRSLLAYCNRLLTREGITGFQVFDFDAHAVEEKLPDSNLIGITNYSITNGTDQYDVICMIAVATLTTDNDLEIVRSTIGKLFNDLRPGHPNGKLEVIDSAGGIIGQLVVKDDVMATPVAKTDTRPFAGINVNFGLGYQSPQP
jgi:hypothetical protein